MNDLYVILTSLQSYLICFECNKNQQLRRIVPVYSQEPPNEFRSCGYDEECDEEPLAQGEKSGKEYDVQ